MAKWKEVRGGGNSLHTASHSMNEAIVAAAGTQTLGNVLTADIDYNALNVINL